MSQNNKDIGKNPSGFKRLPGAIKHSLSGLRYAWKFESGFRQYTTISIILLPFSVYIAQSSMHWIILFSSLIFLVTTEILNSAIEAVADATKPEYDPIIGRAKDLGSAAVFVALVLAIIVWSVAVYEHLTMS